MPDTTSSKPKHVKTTTPKPSTENEGNTVETCEVCTRFVRDGRCSFCGHTPEPTSASVPSDQDDSADRPSDSGE